MDNYLNDLPSFVSKPNPFLYDSDNFVVVDFETTNRNNGDPVVGNNSLVLAVWWYRGVLKTKYGSEYEMQELVSDIEQADFIVAHNAKFECGWLKRCGLDLYNTVVYCTQVAEYILLGTRRENTLKGLALDSCCKRYGIPSKEQLVSKMMKAGICPSEMPRKFLLKYGKQDVLSTLNLFQKQWPKLKKRGQHKVFYTRCLTVPCLADIEFNGMCVDEERVRRVYENKYEQLRRVSGKLSEFIGERNPRSPKQMAEFLYEELGFSQLKDSKGNPLTTATGNPKTDATTIEQLRPRNRKQKDFLSAKLQYGKLNAEITKALGKIRALLDDEVQRLIFASFNLCIANTLRLTSTGKAPYNIQLQNIDRNHKPLFRARNEGWYIGEADEAQLEFRSAGELSKDERILQDIRDGVDVHSFTARTLTEAGQPTSRQEAKSRTFKPLYGGESGTVAEQAYFAEFKRKYSTLADIQERWLEQAINTGKVTMPTGHIFYYGKGSKKPVRVTRTGYVENNQKVKNYPVQYFATGEVVPIALVCAWHVLNARGAVSFIICTIHDSIIGEIHPDEMELFEEVMVSSLSLFPKHYMEAAYGIELTVPLEAETKFGSHWNDSEHWREEWLSS